MIEEFSVLMSLYTKEKPEYLEECLCSLQNQTVKATEWVIVEDGPLTDDLYSILDRYELKNPGFMKRIKLKQNHGLGFALRIGVSECSYELIARMDTDDIAREDRFEKQLQRFKDSVNLDICGSYISEFENEVNNIVSYRRVPLTDSEIKKYQRKRDAFNHVTVMFKKSSVLRAGNYQACPLMEDTYLWARMIQNGAVCCNIPEFLVNVRVGFDMFERRGSMDYYRKYKYGRKKLYELGFINKLEYLFSLFIQFFICIIPNKWRAFAFKRILHR